MRIPKATAYHEAGHAVAAWYAGEYVYAVHVAARDSLFVDRRGRRVPARGLAETSACYNAGLPICAVPPEHAAEYATSRRAKAVVSMMVDLAGPFAQARATRTSQVACLMTNPDDMRNLERTAADFPEKMQGPMKLEAERGAVLVVRHGWAAIDALGRALIEHGSLQGNAVEEIIAGAWADAETIPGIPVQPWAAERRTRAA